MYVDIKGIAVLVKFYDFVLTDLFILFNGHGLLLPKIIVLVFYFTISNKRTHTHTQIGAMPVPD